ATPPMHYQSLYYNCYPTIVVIFSFFNYTTTTKIYTLSLHDALPISASHENNEFFLYNLSYLRLKNLEVGYTVSLNNSRKIGLDNIRFTLSGQNILTWDHMKTDDFGPEGNGFGAIPVYRVYNIGMKLIF